jgi:hypothetical protein
MTSTLTWTKTHPGVWRSTDGRYAIVAQTLPESPPRVVYQVRKVDPQMARAYPRSNTLGYLLEETDSCWNTDDNVFSAQAACERDAWCDAHADTRHVPHGYPAVALRHFYWPIERDGTTRAALTLAWKDDARVAQVVGMVRRDDSGFVPATFAEINLTELGLVAGNPTAGMPPTNDRGGPDGDPDEAGEPASA